MHEGERLLAGIKVLSDADSFTCRLSQPELCAILADWVADRAKALRGSKQRYETGVELCVRRSRTTGEVKEVYAEVVGQKAAIDTSQGPLTEWLGKRNKPEEPA